MGKTVGRIALGVGLIFAAATGLGLVASAAAIGAATAGSTVLALKVALAAGASLTIGGVGNALRGNPGTSLTAFDPKAINADPAAPRKLVFGRTAFPIDLRYFEPSGTDQEYIDYIFALAAHKSDAIESIYIEEDLAWTAGGGAQGKYAGYLTVEVITEAGPSAFHTVNAGATWGANTRLTGCTTMKVRVKRSDNSKTSQSPFASGVNGRWAVIGRGMPVYDPALDSTVAGGSGSQRSNDNTTWAYTVSSVARGNNPALQLLSYLLGWRIGGVVSVGCGMPADTIDLASFATAAALCDESIALAGGGTQRRFEAGRAFSDSDDPLGVVAVLLQSMNGELVDDGGRLALRIAVNDLTAAATLTDDDFVGGYVWRPEPVISQQYTLVRGRYSQPDAPSLFGLVDYPEVAIPRTSLAPRPLVIELSAVQDQRRAERIAKQAAQRSLFQGEFAVTLGIRGWLLRRNMVVAIDTNVRGWTNKLFRVRSLGFNEDGTINATFRPEDASIYAWDADESAVVTPVGRTVFDMRKAASWLMAGIEPGADVTALASPSLDAMPGQVFQADYLGMLAAGQLPRNVQATRRRGADIVSDSTTWSIEAVNCTATISAAGLVSITAVGSTGRATVISVRDGVEMRTTFDVVVQRAAAPATGGSGGGTSVSVTSFTQSPTGSAWTDITGDLTVTTGTSGDVSLAAPLEFFPNISFPPNGFYTYGASLRWRRETSPGVWAVVGSDASETSEAFVERDIGVTIAQSNGSITCNRTATGLGAATTHKFRLQGSTVDATFFIGGASAVGS